MIDNNKVIVRNTWFLYLRAIFSLFLKLYTSRLVLDGLGIESFGVYQVVGGVVMMFSFLNTSMSQATMRYLSFALGKGNRNYSQRVFSTSLVLHAGLALFTLFLIETLGTLLLHSKIDIGGVDPGTVFWLLHFTSFMLLLTIFTVPFNSLIISKEDMGYFAYIDIFTQILILGVALSLSLFSSDRLLYYGFLMFVVSIIKAIIYIIICNKSYKDLRICFHWEKRIGTEMAFFSGWTSLAALASIVQTQGTTIVINIFLGPLVNAALGIANQVNAAVKSFSLNMGVSVGPQIVKSYAQKNYVRLNTLLLSGAKFLLLLFIALAMPLILEIDFFLNLWLVNVPQYTSQLVILLFICSIVDAMTSTYSGAIQATGIIKNYQIVFNTIYLCSLPIMLIIMNSYSFYYVPILIILVFSFITNIVKIPFMIKLIPNYDWRENVKNLFVKIIVTLVFSITIPLLLLNIMESNLIRVIVVGLTFEAVYVFVLFFYTLSSKERSLVQTAVLSIYHKMRNALNILAS